MQITRGYDNIKSRKLAESYDINKEDKEYRLETNTTFTTISEEQQQKNHPHANIKRETLEQVTKFIY